MQVEILRNREVNIESNSLGTVGENNFEKLEFIFPEGFEKYYKTIEMQTNDGKIVDKIENDEYVISKLITEYSTIRAQIVAKDLNDNTVFKSEIFKMKFKSSINAIEELDSESELLIDKLILEIEQTFDRIESLEQDNIQNKQKINNLDNNKVDKIEGMDLSENNFDNNYKNKLDSLENYNDTAIKKDILDIKEKNATQDTEISNIKTKDTEQDNEIAKKLNTTQANPLIKNVVYNNTNATFIFTAFDNTQVVVDLPIESTVKNGRYDDRTKELILVLVSGQEIKIPVTDLIDDYTGMETATIQVIVSADNRISANVKGGSIVENLLSKEVVDKLNKTVDLTPYYKKSETNDLLENLREEKDAEIAQLQEKYNDVKKQLPERTSGRRIHTFKG